MFERNIANKLKGWNLVTDISRKLNVKKNTVYVYLSKLEKRGFIIQKIKKPRGTLYLIEPVPKLLENQGMLSNTELVSTETEFSKNEILVEHKIAYFLQQSKKEKNIRYRKEAKGNIRSIKNWKKLYRYLKAYDVLNEFGELYLESKKDVKKLPSMPKRYKNLIGA